MTEYRDLLKKYMAGIYWCERLDILADVKDSLTEEEYAELVRIDKEIGHD